MPLAGNILQMQQYALQNTWDRYLAPVVLRTRIVSWRDNGLSELDDNIAEQAETMRWLVPTSFLIQRLPISTTSQNLAHVEQVIEILSRTIERIRDLTLTVPQTAAIITAYNTAFAV
ncbi:MAG: hypothetical protein Q8S00_32365 [Deltaproteobacteria bacterium]|nr:hypothetical protein [Deltaproteobacteria bacterium]